MSRSLRLAAWLALALLGEPILAQSAKSGGHDHVVAAPASTVPLYANLGDHSYSITTRSLQAQRYFDQGLRLLWAFNHPEAIRSFEEAERLDASCAMCAWGVAYALGPNINLGMDSVAAVRAYNAVQRARAAASRSSAREQALIAALATRYAAVPPAARAGLDSTYAKAMERVATRFPDDQEAQVLHADALMNLSPWNYWESNGTPRSATTTILRRLEAVMQSNPRHPGACHLFIHAVEAQAPKRALACAERLASLMPGAGHLVHMPGHIYIRIGRYADAIDVNRHAVHADDELMENAGVAKRGIYANGYFPHNWHFMSFAATMAGNSTLAIDAARQTARRLDADAVKAVPWVESVTPIVPLTLVTFGKWRDVLAEPLPSTAVPFQLAMTWYARGVAYAALGDDPAALRAMQELVRISKAVPDGDNALALRIAQHALDGEMAMRTGQTSRAVSAFTLAVETEDKLAYNEPPTWYYPMRHSLGKALLLAGRAKDAERVYREDLARFPENGWALFGLAEALVRQKRVKEAQVVREQFKRAWKAADIQLVSSRF
jgi:tetratricopeptide (TPR) repeat protein